VKLQLLLPGQNRAEHADGQNQHPTVQSASTATTLRSLRDAYWNVVPSANGSAYTIRIASSDGNAPCRPTPTCQRHSHLQCHLKTAGSPTVTA
jgi:hypothetical protein